jgi:hypothetical protein
MASLGVGLDVITKGGWMGGTNASTRTLSKVFVTFSSSNLGSSISHGEPMGLGEN